MTNTSTTLFSLSLWTFSRNSNVATPSEPIRHASNHRVIYLAPPRTLASPQQNHTLSSLFPLFLSLSTPSPSSLSPFFTNKIRNTNIKGTARNTKKKKRKKNQILDLEAAMGSRHCGSPRCGISTEEIHLLWE